MATQPPPEQPAPTPPAQPGTPPPEVQQPGPDTDVPAPMPGPGTSEPQPLGFAMPDATTGATASRVGEAGAVTGDGVGGTQGMDASTGGMAGTSR